jgi:DNA-binding LacI/PurR family transcriptional regulator
MATIRDVAREAGVGVGTVSRVLNGHPQVAAATRERIEAAIAKLGFRPNPLARGLSTRRAQLLEVLVPLFTRHFYVEVLRGIEMGLASTDYGLLIRTIDKPTDRDQAFAQSGSRRQSDGLLIVSLTPPAALIARLRAADCPVVLVDAACAGLSSVQVDHAAAAATAVRYLLGLGHERIALIDHLEDPFTPSYPGERRAGYRRTLADAGLTARPEYERVTDFSPDAGREACAALLAAPDPPTAVFTGSDAQAMGVLDEARRRGVRVPEDLSVLGYNDIDLAQYVGLSTMRVPMRAMGQQGIELLLAALAEPAPPPTQVRLPAQLVTRRTTGPPRKGRLPRPEAHPRASKSRRRIG